MPTGHETPFSIVTSALAKDISIRDLVVVTVFLSIPLVVHYASPARLTDILADDMSKAKTTHDEALEAGQISCRDPTQLPVILEITVKVSEGPDLHCAAMHLEDPKIGDATSTSSIQAKMSTVLIFTLLSLTTGDYIIDTDIVVHHIFLVVWRSGASHK
ncbi:hypothetical protein DFH06DRAFT_1133327 [Mycena polygramma]|nr:hypothetical protein DFH06DRAFT_1133327 [Mycena polygramma]